MAQVKILVVEDEIIVAEAIAESLERQGYVVTGVVTTGEEAIQGAVKTQPDLVLMDIVLEGDMDGITAAEQIRNLCQIPTVFLTAYADEETLQRAKQTSPFGYILKPFQQKDLYATIEIALHRHDELRNPLSAILGSAKLLELNRNWLNQNKQLKYLQVMKSASQTMHQLIEDMLLLGRADNEQLKFNPSLLDVTQFCRQLVQEIQVSAEDKQEIVFSSSPNKIDTLLDRRLLHHILSNLLSNAIKYSPNGGTIRLELEYLPSEQCETKNIEKILSIPEYPVLILRVQDSGIGIPEEDQEQLFAVFYRCSNVGDIRGTGLGLAIVKKAVDLHKGAIAFESQVGVGTTFTVALPIVPLSSTSN
jgi:signal transduction histidine kinase